MVGTMVLVLMGCGVAVSLGCDPVNNIPAVVGTAFAFGLAVVAMAYTIGGISGCHINPAITLGCFLTGRISGKDCGMYMLFQVIGAFIGSLLLFILTENVPGLDGTGANDLQAKWPCSAVCWQRSSLPVCSYWWCWVQQQRPMAPQTTLQDSPLVCRWCWYTSYVFAIRALQ